MENKLFHLGTCSTCQRILKETQAANQCSLQDIKVQQISADDLDFLAQKSGSYEALFSRKALKFRAQGLHEKNLSETDYRNLILEEYTFLKRPVAVVKGEIFIGNLAKTVSALKLALEKR
jgi:arsenate reductase (glutaredoxin)